MDKYLHFINYNQSSQHKDLVDSYFNKKNNQKSTLRISSIDKDADKNDFEEMEEGDEETSESGDGAFSEIKDDKGMIKSLRKRILKEYHIIKVVGKGSYGTVTKARCK